jgi:Fms-interacting protein/Thoc5
MMLNRLQLELIERKRLAGVNVDLKAKKAALMKANKDKLRELDVYDVELDKILQSASALMKLLGMSGEAESDEAGQDKDATDAVAA